MAARTKIKNIKKIIGGNDINSLFEEMMGLKDASPAIILPKFVKSRNLVRHIYKVLMQFSNFVIFQKDFPEIMTGMKEISLFADKMKKSVYFSETEETEIQYRNLSKVELNALYKKIKDNTYIKRLIGLGGKLKRYSTYIDDKNNLRDGFIGQEPGLSFNIFDFSTFDLKVLWANKKVYNNNGIVKKYVLNVLHLLWKDCFELYKIITSPDVDMDKFTEVLFVSIEKLKKTPGLNRCNNAFNRISSSVDLLKNNFDNYYRESVASSNPNMIIESFIVDVSNQGGSNASLTREFRQIIQFIHKQSVKSGKAKSPQIKKMFSVLNNNFKIMEQESNITSNTPVIDEKSDLDNMDLSLKDNNTQNNDKKSNNTDKDNNANNTDTISIYTPAKKSSAVIKKRKRKKKKPTSKEEL